MSDLYDQVSNQRFSDEELQTIANFGDHVTFQDGDKIFTVGETGACFFFITVGNVRIDEPWEDEVICLTRHEPGEFTGDLNLMFGRPAVAEATAEGMVEAIKVGPCSLRSLLVKDTSIGDKIIHVFQRRRELTETGDFRGIKVIGPRGDKATLDMREFFYRNGVGHTWLDSDGEEGLSQLEKDGLRDGTSYPVVHCSAHKAAQVNPQLSEVANATGIQRRIPDELFDTIIIGSGPSGLGAAVYAASEGLRTLVLDSVGPGGQAGSSSKIENYAGFPTGLSGRELALRSQLQAVKFGAEITAPCSSQGIEELSDGNLGVVTCLGQTARTKTVIISTGVSYRTLGIDNVESYRNKGVYYAATQVEATLCQDCPIHIIGGGNSAGQAAMFLSKYCPEVNLIIRGDDLTKSMSSYLSDRVEVNEKIKLRKNTELKEVHGDDRLKEITLIDRETGETSREETGGLFIFIGATPHTDFVKDTLDLDEKGFIQTGQAVAHSERWKDQDRTPCALETSMPGVFASGDVRSGTTKRVAFAIGDGALAVTCVHDYLGTYS